MLAQQHGTPLLVGIASYTLNHQFWTLPLLSVCWFSMTLYSPYMKVPPTVTNKPYCCTTIKQVCLRKVYVAGDTFRIGRIYKQVVRLKMLGPAQAYV